MSDHAVWLDNAAAYLLGALADDERAGFERHLEACVECRREIERLRPAADALPRAVTPVPPPPGLKPRLMEIVEREAAERGRAPARAGGLRARVRGLVPELPRMRPTVAWASAAFLVAVGVAFGVGAGALLSDGDGGGRTLAAAVDAAAAPRASASLTVHEGDDGGTLRVSGMPPLPRGSVYQVWVQRRGEVSSQSAFAVGGDGHGAAAVTDDLGDVDAVMVTRERAPGAPAPTSAPMLRVRL